MTLRVLCRRCGVETDSEGADRTGLCGLCVVADLVAPLKAEYGRLWAKRARYAKAGVRLGSVEEQLARVARRLGDIVHARIAQALPAINVVNGHLEEVRQQVERPNARIHIARPGDLTRRLSA